MTLKQSIASTVLLWFIGICSAQAALISIDLRGNGGNLGHTASFSGAGGVELSVSAFTSDPETEDNVRQNGNGIGTQAGPGSSLNNLDPNFFGQFLSFTTNIGSIVGLDVHGFGRNEELLLVASDTNGVPDIGQFDVLASINGFAGNPDAFAVPAFSRPFLHVLSSLAQLDTTVRIASITVDTTNPVPAGGSAMVMALGLASLLYRRSWKRRS